LRFAGPPVPSALDAAALAFGHEAHRLIAITASASSSTADDAASRRLAAVIACLESADLHRDSSVLVYAGAHG
jgi:hypothetical protein